MDRRQLLDRAAQSGEERVLLAHILDKCEQSRQRNIPSATDFLSPAEQRAAQELLHAAAIHEGYAFRGGYERAERKMLFFLPDWQEEADESESLHLPQRGYADAPGLSRLAHGAGHHEGKTW